MTLAQALQQSAHTLNSNGIDDSHIEARIFLGNITNLSPAQIYTQPERILSQEQEDNLQDLIERRLCHEPTAYIVKHREFYGIDFYVDSRVLIPRPETELLVDMALEFAKSSSTYTAKPILIADIGTGCGAIAVSLAVNLPHNKIYATDISLLALEVAKLNCKRHKVTSQITLLQGNLLEPMPEPIDLLVANLPYIKSSELATLSPEITKFEPRMAIDGGKTGLDYIYQLLQQARGRINNNGCLLLEIGQNQEKEITHLINSCLGKINPEFISDFNGIKRVVKIDFE
ncbi:MAG: peptide chain release factor N(5)-glutamine methyltransferase [Chloroflexota bacterium]|nr:MAG: peptide chain release factor N(5)-glutamine methyltransferase [Chloroflexota bacterium]